MTVTEFVRNLKTIIDRIVPGSAHLTAIEAMGDLYRTLPEDAARGWLPDSRTKGTVESEARDPWA